MATIYGEEIGIGRTALIGTIVIVQFVGIPFSFAFGALASKVGAKNAIFLGLAVYGAISVLGFFMTSATHFLLLGLLVGMVQGGTQALSRSLFGSMIPSHESGEFFGLFAVFEKFAGILGPAMFGVIVAISGSSRNAILSVIAFFLIGALLLFFVDPEEGRRVALDAETQAAQKDQDEAPAALASTTA
jgi:UMF1 family MFS transporter